MEVRPEGRATQTMGVMMGMVTKGIWKPQPISQGVSCFGCLFLAPTYNMMMVLCSFVLEEGQVGAQSPEHLSQEPLKVCYLKSSLSRARTI